MDMQLYAIHVIPFVVFVYLGFLLFMQPPKEVIVATLAGGLVMGIINLVVDLIAYYASWWHYTASGLLLHLPLPLYVTSILIFGGVGYLLIWRFWNTRARWFAWLLIIGIPLFGFVRDLLDALVTHSSFITWDSPLAGPLDFVLWVVMFYAGFFVFRRLLVPVSGEQRPQTNP
ncbi:MAG TPA: hypothetical protein VFA09_27365 [Ktedonobacteraceae bacterium]|nr:hypothetical protein [Ktedonobacteraceae bacterium]